MGCIQIKEQGQAHGPLVAVAAEERPFDKQRVSVPVESHMAIVHARGIAVKSPDARTRRAGDLQGALDRFDAPQTADEVRWFEKRGRGFALHITPLEVATAFDAFREQVDAAWLFTSATLSVRGDFRHFTDRMGLQDAATLQLD